MRPGFIRAARIWMEGLREEDPRPPERLGCAEVEEVLGEKVLECEPWVTNWRTRLYRVVLAGGRLLAAKQFRVQTDSELFGEYEHLSFLGGLDIPGLRMPRSVALIPSRRAYLMELAGGRSLANLIRDRDGFRKTPGACEDAGRILAQIHSVWLEDVRPLPVEALSGDLAEMPCRCSARDRKILEEALERLGAAPVSIGQLYVDFKPPNVFYDRGTLSLIDPPETSTRGVQLWDYALFRAYLLREKWKYRAARSWFQRCSFLEESLTAFERGYFGSYAGPHPDARLLPLLFLLLELQRVGQLMVLERGKRELARLRNNPLASGNHHRGKALPALVTLPLLKAERRRLIGRMARELS